MVYDGNGFILAEFPYGQGNFVMDIILPDAKTGTAGLLPSVTVTLLPDGQVSLANVK